MVAVLRLFGCFTHVITERRNLWLCTHLLELIRKSVEYLCNAIRARAMNNEWDCSIGRLVFFVGEFLQCFLR